MHLQYDAYQPLLTAQELALSIPNYRKYLGQTDAKKTLITVPARIQERMKDIQRNDACEEHAGAPVTTCAECSVGIKRGGGGCSAVRTHHDDPVESRQLGGIRASRPRDKGPQAVIAVHHSCCWRPC